MAKAQQAGSSGPWLVNAAPLFVTVLVAVHVVALVYWIYRLASEKQPDRKKTH